MTPTRPSGAGPSRFSGPTVEASKAKTGLKPGGRWSPAWHFGLVVVALLAGVVSPAVAQDEGHDDAAEHEGHESGSNGLSLARWANWGFFSFLPDEDDDASTLGIELEPHLAIGDYDIKNISYFEVNQYPRPIPNQPPGSTGAGDTVAVDGIGDLLSAFWISKKGHHGGHHLAPGIAFQFPTASDEALGSGKWSVGPSIDYEYDGGRFFGGAIALQIWSFAGDTARADVSMLMIKPFLYYEFAPRWNVIYVPYGITVYWNKPEGEKMYLPLGGGFQYSIPAGSVDINLAAQFFHNVVRPTKGTQNDLRFLIEFAF